jgi:hypothetical protein
MAGTAGPKPGGEARHQRRVSRAKIYVAPLIAVGTKQPKATCAQ